MFINNKILIGLILLIGLSAVSVGLFYLFGNEFFKQSKPEEKNADQKKEIANSSCLGYSEIADHSVPGKSQKEQEANRSYFATSPVIISVKDGETNKEKYSFQIDNNSKGFFTLQLFQCNIYVTIIFNFDEIKGLPLSNYRTELWQYSYDGGGEKLLTLFKEENDSHNYGQSFRIDPFERYVILEQKYFGDLDYALIVKDLNTKKDILILQYKDLIKQNPNLVGNFGLKEWTKDGKYFWFDIFEGANVNAFGRIEKDTWKVDIYPAPKGTKGGDTLNTENGYITYDDGPGWIGVDIFAQQIEKEWKEQGKVASFYLYNLFTEEKTLLFATGEPLWWHKPKWLSGTKLEYELPNGEKKVYKVE